MEVSTDAVGPVNCDRYPYLTTTKVWRTIRFIFVQDYQRELSLNTALNYELRQLKQQETSLLKLLVDHLADCPMASNSLAALSKTVAGSNGDRMLDGPIV